jgi:transmembrane sensor
MEDLAFSRSFRNWVLNRDSAEKGFWENWVARHPEKTEIIKYAKAVIYALHLDRSLLSEDEIDEEVRKALIRLKEAPRYIPLDGLETRGGRLGWMMRSRRVWAAAALLSGLCVGGYLFYRVRIHRDVLQSFLASHKNDPLHQQVADADEDQTFNLPDGSLVRLGKSSKLYFSTDWDSTRRDVFLEGEAYFDIRKNPAAPFYVYTAGVITKVLGTSFVVHAFPAEAKTTVAVLLGQVSVYRADDFTMYASTRASKRRDSVGMVVIPNQVVVYDRGDDRLSKTLTEQPALLGENPDTSLEFRGTPIRRVFRRLEDLYGIPIQYDEEAVDSCKLNAKMGNQSFYEKLRIVCKAIGGTYQEIDGNIVVTAEGCH